MPGVCLFERAMQAGITSSRKEVYFCFLYGLNLFLKCLPQKLLPKAGENNFGPMIACVYLFMCTIYTHTDVFNRLTLFRRPLCKRTVAGACSVGSHQWRGWVEWSQWRLWSCKAGNIPCALSVCHVVNRSRSQVVLHGHPVFLLIQENDGWGSSFL